MVKHYLCKKNTLNTIQDQNDENNQLIKSKSEKNVRKLVKGFELHNF